FDTGFETFDTGFETFDTGFETFDTGFETGFEETDTEDTGIEICDLPPLHPRQALIETNQTALSGITMDHLLQQAATTIDLVGDPEFTFTRIVDSYATNDQAALAGGSHCDDELVNGEPSLNGYPLMCPRAERFHVGQMDQWFPIAAINRFDLTSGDGSDCGEQRVIMASNANGRAFIIFEARIPNPDPQCGHRGLPPDRRVLDQARRDRGSADPGRRNPYGVHGRPPGSRGAGFEPFLTGVNMTFGSGQIRTNSFDSSPWTLRQFQFVTEGDRLSVVEVPVTDNSFGPLWNDLDPHPQGPACRAAILEGLPRLLSDNVNEMALPMPIECLSAESSDDFTSDYASMLLQGSGAFEVEIADALAELGSDLTPLELANRATFASNCMGCHQLAIGLDLGHGISAPSSMGFVHVDEFSTQPCSGGECFGISAALRNQFIPHRRQVLIDFLEFAGCDEVCEQSNPTGDVATLEGPATIGLPEADVPVEALLAWEKELESMGSPLTIGAGRRVVTDRARVGGQ
ncbi:MAG: hypothetical protein HC927_02220, partial [Deltaproteobacteria bacterium]|nr:hypothetical protein [Deltaproteobacteria bacterium]